MAQRKMIKATVAATEYKLRRRDDVVVKCDLTLQQSEYSKARFAGVVLTIDCTFNDDGTAGNEAYAAALAHLVASATLLMAPDFKACLPEVQRGAAWARKATARVYIELSEGTRREADAAWDLLEHAAKAAVL